MTTDTTSQREPELLGQTVVVIGGSAGIGLETARRARAEGLTSSSPAGSRAPRACGARCRTLRAPPPSTPTIPRR